MSEMTKFNKRREHRKRKTSQPSQSLSSSSRKEALLNSSKNDQISLTTTALGGGERSVYPANNALLINFQLSSDVEFFFNKRRLSIQVGAKRAKTCMQRVRFPTELPFLHATVSGWVDFCAFVVPLTEHGIESLSLCTRTRDCSWWKTLEK